MKVIGKDKSKIKKASCNNCATKVQYTKSDIQEQHGTDYGGGPDGCKYLVCPTCSKWIVLESW